MRLILLPVLAIAIWVVIGLLALLGASPARSQGAACAERGLVIERLADGWGEGQVSLAIAASGALIETYANTATGTWSIVVTAPGGPTCLVAAGTDFHLTIEPAGEES